MAWSDPLCSESELAATVADFDRAGIDRGYGFRAIARYEARFAPTEWRPRYIAFRPELPRPPW